MYLALQKLAYKSEAEIYDDFEIPPLTQTLVGIKEDYKNQVILKMVLDGKIIGSVRAYKKDYVCHIGRLIVHPAHQNKGYGKCLIKAIEEYFSDCKKFSLFTGKKSTRNLYFYNSLGYKTVREEYVNDNLTHVYLEKSFVFNKNI
ncbi:MAG: GNAT family N-acetyltransferase [Clostridiaceae bacterium]|nr:GNAT family N-acetyltransferase [Clostridiaceae bacterium]